MGAFASGALALVVRLALWLLWDRLPIHGPRYWRWVAYERMDQLVYGFGAAIGVGCVAWLVFAEEPRGDGLVRAALGLLVLNLIWLPA